LQASEKVKDVDFGKLDLPVRTKSMKKGYHLAFDAFLADSEVKIRVIPDSGAESPTISLAVASRSMHFQHEAKKRKEIEKPRTLVNCEKLQQVQKFYGYCGEAGGADEIRFCGTFRLELRGTDNSGKPKRVIMCVKEVRISPQQEADLLLPLPDLDDFGWAPNRTHVHFEELGVTVPRLTPARPRICEPVTQEEVQVGDETIRVTTFAVKPKPKVQRTVKVAEELTLNPFEERMIRCTTISEGIAVKARTSKKGAKLGSDTGNKTVESESGPARV
jgi:hypothetical protein